MRKLTKHFIIPWLASFAVNKQWVVSTPLSFFLSCPYVPSFAPQITCLVKLRLCTAWKKGTWLLISQSQTPRPFVSIQKTQKCMGHRVLRKGLIIANKTKKKQFSFFLPYRFSFFFFLPSITGVGPSIPTPVVFQCQWISIKFAGYVLWHVCRIYAKL